MNFAIDLRIFVIYSNGRGAVGPCSNIEYRSVSRLTYTPIGFRIYR